MKKQIISALLSSSILITSIIIIYRSTNIQANDNTRNSYTNKYALSYISQMKKQSVTSVEKEINKGKEGSKKPGSDSNSLSHAKIYFSDSVFMGDSLTEPISYYEMLNDKNVVAIKGRNVHSALADIETVSKDNPKKLFLLYGMNDLLYYKDSDRFVDEYEKLIKAILSKMPKTKLYIQSILPVSSKVQKKIPGFSIKRVATFNKALKAMTKKLKIKFVDIRVLIDSDNMYEPDGVHLKIDFYKKLLVYIMKRKF